MVGDQEAMAAEQAGITVGCHIAILNQFSYSMTQMSSLWQMRLSMILKEVVIPKVCVKAWKTI